MLLPSSPRLTLVSHFKWHGTIVVALWSSVQPLQNVYARVFRIVLHCTEVRHFIFICVNLQSYQFAELRYYQQVEKSERNIKAKEKEIIYIRFFFWFCHVQTMSGWNFSTFSDLRSVCRWWSSVYQHFLFVAFLLVIFFVVSCSVCYRYVSAYRLIVQRWIWICRWLSSFHSSI